MNNELYTEIKKRLPAIESLLDKEFIIGFINTPEEHICIHHFDLGLYIRNNILNPNEGLYDAFADAGIYHKDDMSEVILKELLKHLIGKYA